MQTSKRIWNSDNICIAGRYYDLLRLENGKIAEHWDVMETIAEKSFWQNENGKI